MKLVLFTSEDAHYSISKWGNVCDIEVVLIKTDDYGRMDVSDLRFNILEVQKKRNYPFCVTATAGSLNDNVTEICHINTRVQSLISMFIFRNDGFGRVRSIDRDCRYLPGIRYVVTCRCSLGRRFGI